MHINMHIYVGEDLLHFKPMPKVCAMSKVIVLLLSVESLLMDRCHMSYSPIDLIHRSTGRPCRNTKRAIQGMAWCFSMIFFSSSDRLSINFSSLTKAMEAEVCCGRAATRLGNKTWQWDVLCKWCLMGKYMKINMSLLKSNSIPSLG